MPPESEDKKPDDVKPPEKPPETKPEVSFKTKAEFHAEIERKTKSAVNKAIEESQRAFLEKLGIESEEEIPNIVEGVKKTKLAQTETDKLKNDLAKLSKLHGAETERANGLLKWKQQAITQKAISGFQSKTVDLETLTALLSPKIVIGDDDAVTGPNGKSLEDVVEEILKAKPFLKAADHVPGPGTKPGGAKPDGAKPAAKADDDKPNGRPKTLAQALSEQLQKSASEGAGGP